MGYKVKSNKIRPLFSYKILYPSAFDSCNILVAKILWEMMTTNTNYRLEIRKNRPIA
jgi:hypothetical protein